MACGQRRVDAVRNRERVVAAARAELAERGSSLPMNEVARRAGVGVGTVYRHFPTRRALLEALAVTSLGGLADAAELARKESDPLTALDRLLRSILTLLSDNPGLEAVFAEDAPQSHEALDLLARFGEAVDDVLAKARIAGAVRADVTADDIRRLSCGVAHATEAGPDARAKAGLYVQIVLAGLGPSGTMSAAPARGGV